MVSDKQFKKRLFDKSFNRSFKISNPAFLSEIKEKQKLDRSCGDFGFDEKSAEEESNLSNSEEEVELIKNKQNQNILQGLRP